MRSTPRYIGAVLGRLSLFDKVTPRGSEASLYHGRHGAKKKVIIRVKKVERDLKVDKKKR